MHLHSDVTGPCLDVAPVDVDGDLHLTADGNTIDHMSNTLALHGDQHILLISWGA